MKRELELRGAPPASLDSCSALVNFSTRFRVSLGDNSPSSPHLRLEMSGGHMRFEVHFSQTRDAEIPVVPMLPEDYGRNSELSAPLILSGEISVSEEG